MMKALNYKTHIEYMKEIGIDDSSSSENIGRYVRNGERLVKKHSVATPEASGEDEGHPRKIILPE